MTIENIIKNHFKNMDEPKKEENPENPNDPNHPDYYLHEHDLFKLDEKGNIITDVPTQIRNLIANEPCNKSLDCISLKEFTIKYGIHRILGLEKPEQVTYDYFDYKRNKAVVLGPDSPLYILQNMLTKEGSHADPGDPYHNEVLYPELSMEDIDPEMDMRELAHYMRPNSDFYVFIQDPLPNIRNLSVRKHPYQIGNTLRTVTMGAGNIFRIKNPTNTLPKKNSKKFKSIHKKIASKEIDLSKIPYILADSDKTILKSLNSSKNKSFFRPQIYEQLIKYISKRSNMKIYLPYSDVYNNIFKFEQITRQCRYSENIQGYYFNDDYNFSDGLKGDFLKLFNDSKKIKKQIEKEAIEKLNKDLLDMPRGLAELKNQFISKLPEEEHKETKIKIAEISDYLLDTSKLTKVTSISTLLEKLDELKKQFISNIAKEYIKEINDKFTVFSDNLNNYIRMNQIINSFPTKSTMLFLQTFTDWKQFHKKSVYPINLKISNIFSNLNSYSDKDSSYNNSLSKNQKSIFQNLRRTAEKIFGSRPFSHASGLVQSPKPTTFFQTDNEKIIPSSLFPTNDLKPLNQGLIKRNKSFFHPNNLAHKFLQRYLDLIQKTGDFSSIISEIKSTPKKSKIKKISSRGLKITKMDEEKFDDMFDNYTKYGIKFAFFSKTKVYSEDLEDNFKFGTNEPQIYLDRDFTHIRLDEKKIELIKEGLEENLTELLSPDTISTESFFALLIKKLKGEYEKLENFKPDLDNIVSEKPHRQHILNVINVCSGFLSGNPLRNQKLPIQYIHFSQGFMLLKSVIELVDRFTSGCEKCTSIKDKLDSIKTEIDSLYSKKSTHWDFFIKLTKKENHIVNFSKKNPLFSTKGYIMKARELWFDEQIKNMKIVISLLLNNPQIECSETITKLKEIIKNINKIKRRQPSFDEFEGIASKIKTEYKNIKGLIPESETNEDLKKILKLIDNFIEKEISLDLTYSDFDDYKYLYADPINIKNDDDSFHRIFTKFIKSERDISKILYKIMGKTNPLSKKPQINKYPIIYVENIYRWKQNLDILKKPKKEQELNPWTENKKEIIKPDFDNFNWRNIWHDHRQLNYLCHHVIKLDSAKNLINPDHIGNSKELVQWLESKNFTPAMIETNWEKDNESFLLTKRLLKRRNYLISSLKDIVKIKQALYEEKQQYPEFNKELIFKNIFNINTNNILSIKRELNISAEILSNYNKICTEFDITPKKAVENHFILHQLLQRPNFRKTNFEVFAKKISLENIKELERYQSYSLQSFFTSTDRDPVSFHHCIVGHYNTNSDKNTKSEKNEHTLRQIYIMAFLRKEDVENETDNYFLITSKFGLNTKKQFERSEDPLKFKNWRIFQEFKDLTDSLVELCPPDIGRDNFWTSKIYDSSGSKNFTTCYYDDHNNNGPPLNYTLLKFKQFLSSFDNIDDILGEIELLTDELKNMSFIVEESTKMRIENLKIEFDNAKTIQKRNEIKEKIKNLIEKSKRKIENLKIEFNKANTIKKKKELLEKIKNLIEEIEKVKDSDDFSSFLKLAEILKKHGMNSSNKAEFLSKTDEIIKKYILKDFPEKIEKKSSSIFYLKKDPLGTDFKRITKHLISLLYRKTETKYQQLLSQPSKSILVSIKPTGKIIMSVACAIPFIHPTSYNSRNKLGIDLGMREFLNCNLLETITDSEDIKSKKEIIDIPEFNNINTSLEARINDTTFLTGLSSQFQQKIDLNKFKKSPSYFGIHYSNYKQKINSKEQNIANTSMRQSIEVIADFIKNKENFSRQHKKTLLGHLNDKTSCYIENLKGFQSKGGSKYSEAAARWLRGNFNKYLDQKSILDGFVVRTVPPAYTSKLCSVCRKEGLKGYLIVIPTAGYKDAKDKLGYLRKKRKILFAPEKPKISKNIKIPDINDDDYRKATLEIWDYKRILNKLNMSDGKGILKEENKQSLVFIFSQSGIVFYCPKCAKYSHRDINASANIHTYNPIMNSVYVINLWIARKSQFPRKYHKKIKNKFYWLFTKLSEALSYKVKNATVGPINKDGAKYSKENENTFISFENLSDSEFNLLVTTLEKSIDIVNKKDPEYFKESKKLEKFKKSIKTLEKVYKKDSDPELIRFKTIESKFQNIQNIKKKVDLKPKNQKNSIKRKKPSYKKEQKEIIDSLENFYHNQLKKLFNDSDLILPSPFGSISHIITELKDGKIDSFIKIMNDIDLKEWKKFQDYEGYQEIITTFKTYKSKKFQEKLKQIFKH